MELYLIQHAEAKSKEEDAERGLSETGFANIRKTAAFAKRLAVTVEVIYHSDKLRAVQTAKELSGSINSVAGLKQRDEIAPMDNITSLKEEVNKTDKNIMVVGHLPYLSKLTSALLSGDENRDVVTFQNGCIVKLVRSSETREWSLKWMITPEIS